MLPKSVIDIDGTDIYVNGKTLIYVCSLQKFWSVTLITDLGNFAMTSEFQLTNVILFPVLAQSRSW